MKRILILESALKIVLTVVALNIIWGLAYIETMIIHDKWFHQGLTVGYMLIALLVAALIAIRLFQSKAHKELKFDNQSDVIVYLNVYKRPQDQSLYVIDIRDSQDACKAEIAQSALLESEYVYTCPVAIPRKFWAGSVNGSSNDVHTSN